jgi:hypothetical protein
LGERIRVGQWRGQNGGEYGRDLNREEWAFRQTGAGHGNG